MTDLVPADSIEPTLAHTFAATYPGAPERTTRAQAERDMCQHGVMRPAVALKDCYFRMLTPRESANAQAFPDDYIITGNLGEQQKQAGNAVAVNVAAWLGRAAAQALDAA